MLMRSLIAMLVLCASLAFAQLDSNSVTVTASRNAILQPDQAVFAVQVNSGLDATLDDIIAALQGSGVGLGNFTGINTIQQFLGADRQPTSVLQWSFTLPVPLAKMKDTLTAFT